MRGLRKPTQEECINFIQRVAAEEGFRLIVLAPVPGTRQARIFYKQKDIEIILRHFAPGSSRFSPKPAPAGASRH